MKQFVRTTEVKSIRQTASNKQGTSICKTASSAEKGTNAFKTSCVDPEQPSETGGAKKGTRVCKTASKTKQCTSPCKTSRADMDYE